MPCFFSVLYTKKALNKKRKNKSFADGLLAADDATHTLYDKAGRTIIEEALKGGHDLAEGAEVTFEAWDVEVDQEVSEENFRQRRQAMRSTAQEESCAPKSSAPAVSQKRAKSAGIGTQQAQLQDAFYSVIYTARAPGKKRQNKIFKDGVLRLRSASLLLYDEEGKVIAEGIRRDMGHLEADSEVAVGRWEAEVVELLSEEAFRAGSCFEKSAETLLFEKMLASRSAGAAGRHERGSAAPLSSFGNGRRSSMNMPCSAVSALQQQSAQPCKGATKAVESTGSPEHDAAEVPTEAGPLKPPEHEQPGTGAKHESEAVMGRSEAQKEQAASNAFLDDVDCLDIE